MGLGFGCSCGGHDGIDEFLDGELKPSLHYVELDYREVYKKKSDRRTFLGSRLDLILRTSESAVDMF